MRISVYSNAGVTDLSTVCSTIVSIVITEYIEATLAGPAGAARAGKKSW